MKTGPLPRLWVYIPSTPVTAYEGLDDTWFHVPCQRYYASAMRHDCQNMEISERNTGMFRRAKRYRAAGMSKEECLADLMVANSQMPDPLPEEEMRRLVEEAYHVL